MTYRELFECDVPGCNAQGDTDRGAPPRMPSTWANLTTGLAADHVADLDLCQGHTRGVLEYLGLVPNVLDGEVFSAEPRLSTAYNQSGDPA